MSQGNEVFAKKYLSENYDCDEYLSKYEDGYYHKESYLQLLLPVSEVSIDSKTEHLVIGHAGADGIEFCFRIHKPGIWAYHPMEGRFQKVAVSISKLIEGWHSGAIKV
ncbi:hypothetical protein [Alkalimarinus sediminis]|uniref:Uncharacterized protein n=1 Tax=Alkalimarinus sediminis TaxID=1632866 RepID=A0A9E8KKN8_9ALTE|nr:hypothetical protein [Alkalimarinus sediminis]UZW76371.1 hypothetical protein NNL22_07230 [Alkalimarinus sediminis]